MNLTTDSSAPPARGLPALLRRFSELGHAQLRKSVGDDPYPGAGTPPVDKLAEQLLFERWLKRERWRLEDEALPLLAGIDPEQWRELEADEDLHDTAAALTRALHDAFAADSGNDGLAPAALYRWARRRDLPLPAAFDQLMQFIQSVVKGEEDAETIAEQASTGAAVAGPDGERILGAALNVLSKWPERCRDEYGNISARCIAGLIHQHAALWFDTGRPALDEGASIALIERWLE